MNCLLDESCGKHIDSVAVLLKFLLKHRISIDAKFHLVFPSFNGVSSTSVVQSHKQIENDFQAKGDTSSNTRVARRKIYWNFFSSFHCIFECISLTHSRCYWHPQSTQYRRLVWVRARAYKFKLIRSSLVRAHRTDHNPELKSRTQRNTLTVCKLYTHACDD